LVTTTSKLALNKPDTTDLVDIAVLNQNADKLDTAAGAFICTSSTRPSSPWNGQIIFETDSLNVLVYRTSIAGWVTVGGSTVSATPPSTAGSGNLWWDSDNGKLYIYYSDGNSSQWVAVIPGSGANQAATNVLINSDFAINQRAFTSITANGYGFDRWAMYTSGGTTHTPQTFTPGSGPVAGIEAANYARLVTTGQTGTAAYTQLAQKIEDVRTLAGKTVTVSFYAKAVSGTPKVAVELAQSFGTGGSPSADVSNYAGQVTLSTSWARYSVTMTLPGLSGKTLGTTANTSYLQMNLWTSAGTDFNARTGSLGIQSNTFDFWGVQVEENPQATAYKRNQLNLEAELTACQRYYLRLTAAGSGFPVLYGFASSSSTVDIHVLKNMRTGPTALETPNITLYRMAGTGQTINGTTPSLYVATSTHTVIRFTGTPGQFAGGEGVFAYASASPAHIGLSAEL